MPEPKVTVQMDQNLWRLLVTNIAPEYTASIEILDPSALEKQEGWSWHGLEEKLKNAAAEHSGVYLTGKQVKMLRQLWVSGE